MSKFCESTIMSVNDLVNIFKSDIKTDEIIVYTNEMIPNSEKVNVKIYEMVMNNRRVDLSMFKYDPYVAIKKKLVTKFIPSMSQVKTNERVRHNLKITIDTKLTYIQNLKTYYKQTVELINDFNSVDKLPVIDDKDFNDLHYVSDHNLNTIEKLVNNQDDSVIFKRLVSVLGGCKK